MSDLFTDRELLIIYHVLRQNRNDYEGYQLRQDISEILMKITEMGHERERNS